GKAAPVRKGNDFAAASLLSREEGEQNLVDVVFQLRRAIELRQGIEARRAAQVAPLVQQMVFTALGQSYRARIRPGTKTPGIQRRFQPAVVVLAAVLSHTGARTALQLMAKAGTLAALVEPGEALAEAGLVAGHAPFFLSPATGANQADDARPVRWQFPPTLDGHPQVAIRVRLQFPVPEGFRLAQLAVVDGAALLDQS